MKQPATWILISLLFLALNACSGQGLLEQDLVDIPVTIAKLDTPDPQFITVEVQDHEVHLMGNGTAILNPEVNKNVMIHNMSTDEERIGDVTIEGTFDMVAMPMNDASDAIAVMSYDDEAAQMSDPVILHLMPDGVAEWTLTSGEVVYEGNYVVIE